MKCYFDVERLYSIKIIVIVVLAIISGNALERSSACRAGECLQEETTGENSDEPDWISLFNGGEFRKYLPGGGWYLEM